MIPHRQEYPLRKRISPLLADRRQAERALLPSRSSKPCTVGVQRLISATEYVSRPGQVAAASKQDARDTVKIMADRCAWWSIDHDRGARAALAQAKIRKFLHSRSAPRCCGVVTSRSQLRFVAVVGENDSLTLSFFFQAVTDRCAPAFGAFFYWFSVWKRRRRSAWSWRSTVGGSFFFLSSPLELPAIRLEGILLLTPSFVGLLLQYTRNPRQTGRKRKRSSTHRRSPATNKVVEILILGTYLLLDHSFDYLLTTLWRWVEVNRSLRSKRKVPQNSCRWPAACVFRLSSSGVCISFCSLFVFLKGWHFVGNIEWKARCQWWEGNIQETIVGEELTGWHTFGEVDKDISWPQ